jgi:hypothetical protein
MVEMGWECAVLGEMLARFGCGSLLQRRHFEDTNMKDKGNVLQKWEVD